MTAPALPPPLVLTGDDTVDEALALLRSTTQAIHEAQDKVTALSAERRRIVLDLRDNRRVPVAQVARAADSTEQTVYKVLREARDERRDLAHVEGDHQWCDRNDDGECVLARDERRELAHAADDHQWCDPLDDEHIDALDERAAS